MSSVEERLERIEKDVAELKAKAGSQGSKPGWIEKIVGSFKDDPEFDEILRLGREERKADLVNEK